MKRISFILLTGVFMFTAGMIYGQKIKSGDFKVLNGQTVVILKYDYADMKVGKFKTEDEYLKNGIAERNKKKPGSGDDWANKWASDKSDRFEPMFQKEFNNVIDKCGITGKEDASDAKYTLIVRTTFLEQGFQSGMGPSRSASINMIVDLVETANPGQVLASIDYPKIPSVNMMGYDYDTGERIKSCYDRAGGNIGALICKSMKK
jgi:hypothetical protein